MPRKGAGVLSVAWLNIFTKGRPLYAMGRGRGSFRGVVEHIH